MADLEARLAGASAAAAANARAVERVQAEHDDLAGRLRAAAADAETAAQELALVERQRDKARESIDDLKEMLADRSAALKVRVCRDDGISVLTNQSRQLHSLPSSIKTPTSSPTKFSFLAHRKRSGVVGRFEKRSPS